MSVIIHAASSSGKSTFAKYARGPRGIPVVDLDHTIASFNAWPSERAWWKDPVKREAIDRRHAEIVVATLARNPDLVCVFNTNTELLVKALADVSIVVRHVAVVPPIEVAKQRALARIADVQAGVGGHKTAMPVEWYLQGREKLSALYQRLGIRIFPDFMSVAKELRLHVSGEYSRLNTEKLKATDLLDAGRPSNKAVIS